MPLSRPSCKCQRSALGVAPSRSRAHRKRPSSRTHSDTREPRARRAVGAQRRTSHGAAPSAHAPGRDGRRALRPDDILRDRNRACCLPQIRRTRAAASAPYRTSTLRGVNDPNRHGAWGRIGHATRGSFTPRSRATDCARTSSDGTRRRPISTASTRTTSCRSVSFGPLRRREPRTMESPTRMAVRVMGGQVRFRHLSLAWRHSHRNQRRRLRRHRPLVTASTAHYVSGVAGANRTEMRRRVDARFRRRRPGGRGARIASG